MRDRRMPSLAIGPLNTAGQAYRWSEAVSRELGISAWSFAGTRRRVRRIDGPAHHRIPHHRLRPRMIRRLWLECLLRSRTHVLVESMVPLLGDLRHGVLHDDVGLLEERGLTVGVICHGSDIRSPERHMARLDHSYFRLWGESVRNNVEEQVARRRDALEVFETPSFVSTPDLILDLPTATWLPLVVDSRRWASDRNVLRSGRPVVLHAPSQRKLSIKGTEFIEPVLVDLDRRGLIEYRALTGLVPHSRMPELVKEADVLVEQILAGSYGVAAVEGMAAGCLVIGYVGDEVRSMMPEDPPILDATPDGFAGTMMRVLEERNGYADLAASGPAYVERIHSGRLSASVLSPFLGV